MPKIRNRNYSSYIWQFFFQFINFLKKKKIYFKIYTYIIYIVFEEKVKLYQDLKLCLQFGSIILNTPVRLFIIFNYRNGIRSQKMIFFSNFGFFNRKISSQKKLLSIGYSNILAQKRTFYDYWFLSYRGYLNTDTHRKLFDENDFSR